MNKINKFKQIRNILLLSLFLILITHKTIDANITKFVLSNNNTNIKDTVFWIDTLTSNKFLRIYTTPDNDFDNLYAEWGNNKIKNKLNLKKGEFSFLNLPFDHTIEWITDKSFALVDGCGTNCRYVIIFNIEKVKPVWMPIEYYPNMKYSSFITDNSNLYIASNQSNKVYPSIIVVDTDTQKTDTLLFSKYWIKGQISYFIDNIKIKKNRIEIKINNQEGENKTFIKNLKLK